MQLKVNAWLLGGLFAEGDVERPLAGLGELERLQSVGSPHVQNHNVGRVFRAVEGGPVRDHADLVAVRTKQGSKAVRSGLVLDVEDGEAMGGARRHWTIPPTAFCFAGLPRLLAFGAAATTENAPSITQPHAG
jgi:hypothetical protein